MTKRAKEIMETEADIIELYEKTHDDFIKCLTRENITDDEKESILKSLDELERIRSDRDRSNSESWYKIDLLRFKFCIWKNYYENYI